jgi:hypothetical protein
MITVSVVLHAQLIMTIRARQAGFIQPHVTLFAFEFVGVRDMKLRFASLTNATFGRLQTSTKSNTAFQQHMYQKNGNGHCRQETATVLTASASIHNSAQTNKFIHFAFALVSYA